MKIYIKDEDGKKYHIPLPIWVIKLGLSNTTIKIATKNLSPENKKQLEQINFKELSRSFGELKEYKGLKIVDIKSKDGTEVTITL